MLALRIAIRYLFAKKSHRAVNVISIIAMAGVAVATMAIVVVLSVFNGFTELSRSHLSKIDPDLLVKPVMGKAFASADSLCAELQALPQVAMALPVLSERGLAISGQNQLPVRLKGVVPDLYSELVPIEQIVIDGACLLGYIEPDSLNAVIAAVGPALSLRIRPGLESSINLYVPRRQGRINPANPAAAYRTATVTLAGVFQVEQPEYDADYIFVDIALLQRLLDYSSDYATSIELKVAGNAADAAEAVQALLGDDFEVLTRERQQVDTFRMISVEKWITFLLLVFILIIASFNIVTSLSLLVIEKRSNMTTLRALGAQRGLVAAVFAWEGSLITAFGGVIGTIVGVVLSLMQEHFGLIRLGADPTALSIDVYPVSVEFIDVAIVLATLIVLGFLIGQLSRVFTAKIA